MRVDWFAAKGLPRPVSAVLTALRRDGRLEAVDDWRPALDWLDRNGLTLLFGERYAAELPAVVSDRIASNRTDNRLRTERLRAERDGLRAALGNAGVDHVWLKGFTHAPAFVPAAELRPSYDLDLWVRPDDARAALEVARGLAFETASEADARFPVDHLPPLVRKTGWEWRGDFFDPEIPPVLEIHYRLWDEATEGFAAAELEGLWERRADDALALRDRLRYAAAHLVRHLLRGNVKALHVYEISRYLERRGPPADPGPIEALALELAGRWFGGYEGDLPPRVACWFDAFAATPATSPYRPSKAELWLHFELLHGIGAKARVARRRLFPSRLPGAIEGRFSRDARPTLGRAWRYARHVAGRAGRHAVTLGRFASEGLRLRAL